MTRTVERRESQVNRAYAQLKVKILSNAMPPGYQASEPGIANSLKMSRTPVRAALVRLQEEGLLKLVPRHGARVLPVSPDDTREIYELLALLEPESAASLATRSPDENELQALLNATQNMEIALKKRDLDSWAAAEDVFHRILAAASGNSRHTRLVSELLDYAHRARLVTLYDRPLPAESTREYRIICDYIQAGNAAATRPFFTRHCKRTAIELLDILERYQHSQQ